MKTKAQYANNGAARFTRCAPAFTLVEMLLVVTIIGILAGLTIPVIMHRSEDTRFTAVRADINGGIKTAIDNYDVDNGVFPKSLQDLLQQSSAVKQWKGPYLGKLPIDPWGNAYVYYCPGKHEPDSYDLLSVGPDGKEGTADDIGNWMK